MQSERNTREDEQQQKVSRIQSGRLEYRLHEGNVDQAQLHDERDRNRRDEHPVLSDAAAETAILNRRNEIEEDETCECLRREKSALFCNGGKMSCSPSFVPVETSYHPTTRRCR